MLQQLVTILVLVVSGLVVRKIYRRVIFAYAVRKRYNDIPHLPRHWLFGNLINVGKRLDPSINQHPDYAFEEMWNELGRPPAFFVDLAPVDRAMLIICHPQIAEAITQPSTEYKYSTPKSDTLQALKKLIGGESLLILEGEEWRNLRRRFNKGFAPAHLNTLLPLVVSKTKIFVDKLKKLARDHEAFELMSLASDLTMDVITQVAIDKDFHAQTLPPGTGEKSKYGLLTAIMTMSSLMDKPGQGFQLASYLDPRRKVKEYIFDKIYTRKIYNEIVSKLPDVKSEKAASSTRAIVQLSIAGLDPTPAVLRTTISSVKSFLFAGEDTTATLIQWMMFYLSQTYPSSPFYTERLHQIRERLCIEHDEVFGTSNPFAALELLSRTDINTEEILGTKLPYTTAFIKETLRLSPPAASARIVPMAPFDASYPNNTGSKPYFLDMPAWTNCNTGEYHEARRIRADGMRLYNTHFLIHRNPEIWGPDVATFDPSRFLDRSGKAGVDELEEALKTSSVTHNSTRTPTDKGDLPHPHHVSTLPTGSFRAFERGPRSCIGSNLAYMEAKIILAATTRGFQWQKIGLDGKRPPSGEVNYRGTGKEDVTVGEARKWVVWGVQQVTMVPVDGMNMKVQLQKNYQEQVST